MWKSRGILRADQLFLSCCVGRSWVSRGQVTDVGTELIREGVKMGRTGWYVIVSWTGNWRFDF